MPGEQHQSVATIESQRVYAGFIAKKLCPDLIFVSNHFSRYSDMSNTVMSIFRRYDPNMSAAGCDEGYLK
jgi:DNA polymerase kappa